MATYLELRQASEDPTLNIKVQVACVIAAEAVRTEDPATANHANRLAWAKSVYSDPTGNSRRMVWAVLGQNAAATLAQITGVSDATVQTAVTTAVNVFATVTSTTAATTP